MVGTDVGLFVSINGGTTFSRVSGGLSPDCATVASSAAHTKPVAHACLS